MNISLRNKYLSRQRFSRYLLATRNNNLRAKSIREMLYDLINWMAPDLVPYFQSIDGTDNKRIQIMSILN